MAIEIVSFLEITSDSIKAEHVEFRNMLFSLSLINDVYEITSIEIPSTYATIRKTSSGSYVNITGKLNDTSLETLLALVDSSNILMTLSMVGVDNSITEILSEELPLSEYRVDEGTSSISITVTSRDSLRDTNGYNVTLDKAISKDKKILSTGIVEWDFEFNPLNYRYIGIGKTITVDGIESKVTSKNLVLTPEQTSLTVGATEL